MLRTEYMRIEFRPQPFTMERLGAVEMEWCFPSLVGYTLLIQVVHAVGTTVKPHLVPR